MTVDEIYASTRQVAEGAKWSLEHPDATREELLDSVWRSSVEWQQAYQASAKIIQASQQLFDSLLSAVGR